MHEDYMHLLADAIKRSRSELGMTQEEVAERINVTPRTVMNIENYTGNPKMETLFPLIRLLKIDAREIFNPELQRDDPSIRQLRFLIEDCSAQEAAMLIPIIEAVLNTTRMRDVPKLSPKKKKE